MARPRCSPWKCAWAAIRKSATRRTAPSVSGATSSRASSSAKSPAATSGLSDPVGLAPGDHEHGRPTTRRRPRARPRLVLRTGSRRPRRPRAPRRATARRAIANTTIGPADSIGIRRIRRPRCLGPRAVRSFSAAAAAPAESIAQSSGAAVATLHEGLVVLVGGGVAAGEQEARAGRRGRASSRSRARATTGSRAARTRRSGSACGRPGRSAPRPESRLGWSEKKKIAPMRSSGGSHRSSRRARILIP